jgi:methionyl aminopeptidase
MLLVDSTMSVDPHPDFVRAGKIAARVLSEVIEKVKPGEKILTICALAEKKTLDYGGRSAGIAFPCNVSLNQQAAHYTSPYGDTSVLPEKGLVKVDLGVHVNGYISDTAVTVDLDGSFERFVSATEEALNEAIAVIKPGISLGDVGAVIERAIRRRGLRPVHQLSGHQLKQWILHAGKSVPNVGVRRSEQIEVGETYAVEPFSTDGDGTVRSAQNAFIYSNVMTENPKVEGITREVLSKARQKFGTLPWASRWLHESSFDVIPIIHTLVNIGAVRQYPVLIEGKGGMVAQSEHSLFVSNHGAIVTTERSKQE